MQKQPLSILAASIGIIWFASPAEAQLGDIFGKSSSVGIRSAWEQLPRDLLSCMDAALQQEQSSVNKLIRQNVDPNGPQFRDLRAKCEQELRSKPVGAAEPIQAPEWKTYSLEKRFAYFLETFWVGRRLTSSACMEDVVRGKSYFDQKKCLVLKGFWFESGSPDRCTVVIRERLPMVAEPAKTWDGKIIGKEIVGREITFKLTGLDEALIRKNSAWFDLYFEMIDPSSVIRRIALSNDPGSWIVLPSPPLTTGLKLPGSDDGRYQELMRLRLAWASELGRYGNVDIPGFEISSFASQQDTNSEEGLKRLRDNRMRTFLLVTAPIAYASRAENKPSVSLMNNEFVETVKAILSECKK